MVELLERSAEAQTSQGVKETLAPDTQTHPEDRRFVDLVGRAMVYRESTSLLYPDNGWVLTEHGESAISAETMWETYTDPNRHEAYKGVLFKNLLQPPSETQIVFGEGDDFEIYSNVYCKRVYLTGNAQQRDGQLKRIRERHHEIIGNHLLDGRIRLYSQKWLDKEGAIDFMTLTAGEQKNYFETLWHRKVMPVLYPNAGGPAQGFTPN